jgi:hypothetical protein
VGWGGGDRGGSREREGTGEQEEEEITGDGAESRRSDGEGSGWHPSRGEREG